MTLGARRSGRDDAKAFSAHAAASEAPDRVALVSEGRATTYAELATRVASMQLALHGRGVAGGARVAVRGTNRVETVVLVHAVVAMGATVVPLHPRLTAPECDATLRASAATLVLDDAGVDALAASGARTANAVSPPDVSVGEAMAAAPLAILFTSGTTGLARGAVLSAGAFAASAAASAANVGWREHDRWLLCMPMCHVGGLSVLTRCVAARRTVVLHSRFDADAVIASIVRDGTTLLSVVPTMLHALLAADTRGALARLRAVLVGGAAAAPELLAECVGRRIRALATYGLTEACSQVTAQRLADPPTTRGAGPPLPGVELRVRDDRIEVRGATRMTGYLGAAPLVPTAWFDTGDIGELDARGHLVVHSRRVDLIVTGGENVYPAEVEAALEACVGVRRAIVFGVPDERWGQLVAAAIEPDPAAPPASAESIAAELALRLASFKRPRRMCVVPSIPTLRSGKLDRAGARVTLASQLRPVPTGRRT